MCGWLDWALQKRQRLRLVFATAIHPHPHPSFAYAALGVRLHHCCGQRSSGVERYFIVRVGHHSFSLFGTPASNWANCCTVEWMDSQDGVGEYELDRSVEMVASRALRMEENNSLRYFLTKHKLNSTAAGIGSRAAKQTVHGRSTVCVCVYMWKIYAGPGGEKRIARIDEVFNKHHPNTNKVVIVRGVICGGNGRQNECSHGFHFNCWLK